MFILDSLMISGIRWALETALTAAEAEMNDDSVLREQLIETELRREMGEISDEEFQDIERDLLARIREIKERREGGAGPLAFGGAQPMETADGSTFQIEASVSGDFHDAGSAPHTTVLEPLDHHHAIADLVGTAGTQAVEVLDMEPGDAAPPAPAPPQPARRQRAAAPQRRQAQRPTAPRAATRAAASPRAQQPRRGPVRPAAGKAARSPSKRSTRS